MCAHTSPRERTVMIRPGCTVTTEVTVAPAQEPNTVGSVPSLARTVTSIAPPGGAAVGPSTRRLEAVRSGVASNTLRSMVWVVGAAVAEPGKVVSRAHAAAAARLVRTNMA